MRLLTFIEAKNPTRLTPEMMDKIRQVRHECRADEGGGGMCHIVSELIDMWWGWDRMSGTYCSSDGEPVCTGHLWNIMPDGSLLDATADQLGSKDDIKIVHPDDPEFKQYRLEWYVDYHPGHPDIPADDPVHGEDWSGELDDEWVDANPRPAGWHLGDDEEAKGRLRDYYRQWLKHADANPKAGSYMGSDKFARKQLADLDESDKTSLEYLYHGTDPNRINDFIIDGIPGPSYWGSMETAKGYGDALIKVSVSELLDTGMEPNHQLADSYEDSDPDVYDNWYSTDKTWQDSLDWFDSVVVTGHVSIDDGNIVRDLGESPQQYPHPKVMTADQIEDYVMSIHAYPEDMGEGDLQERIHSFSQYHLIQMDPKSIPDFQWGVDEHLRDQYAEDIRSGSPPPPIVIQELGYVVIDGAHRLAAALYAGLKKISVYIGYSRDAVSDEDNPFAGHDDLHETFFSANIDVLMPIINGLMQTAARPLIFKLWKHGSKNAVLALAAIKRLHDKGDPNPIATLYKQSDLDVPTQFLKRLAWEAGLRDIPGVAHKPGLMPTGGLSEAKDVDIFKKLYDDGNMEEIQEVLKIWSSKRDKHLKEYRLFDLIHLYGIGVEKMTREELADLRKVSVVRIYESIKDARHYFAKMYYVMLNRRKLKKQIAQYGKFTESVTTKTVYHVTDVENVPKIQKAGLVPMIGPNSADIGEQHPAVHVFLDKASLEDAVMNWGLMNWDDGELSLITLEVPTNIIDHSPHLIGGHGIIYQIIPPSMITSIAELY